MDWEFTLFCVALLCGISAMVLLFIRKYRMHTNSKETYGTLNVDCSDSADGPYLYLELAVPIADIIDQKQVTFRVNVIPNISQK